MREIIVATDGSALKNPHGVAGWAWYVDEARWDHGAIAKGSNQVAEGLAIYAAIKALPKDVPLRIQTDSKFWVNTLGENGRSGWRAGWKRKGWIKADGKPPANLTLLKELDRVILSRTRPLRLEWVRGHANHTLNEIADALCTHATAEKRQGREVKGPGWRAKSESLIYEYALPPSAAKILGTNSTPKPPSQSPPKQRPHPVPAPAPKTPSKSRQQAPKPPSSQPANAEKRRVNIKTRKTTPGYKNAVLNPPTPTQRKRMEEAAKMRRNKPSSSPRRRKRVDNSITTFMEDDDDTIIPVVVKNDPTHVKREVCPTCNGVLNQDTSECRCSF